MLKATLTSCFLFSLCFIVFLSNTKGQKRSYNQVKPQVQAQVQNELYVFTGDYCGACVQLKRHVLSNGQVKENLEEYSVKYVKVETMSARLRKAWGIKTIPLLVFVERTPKGLIPGDRWQPIYGFTQQGIEKNSTSLIKLLQKNNKSLKIKS